MVLEGRKEIVLWYTISILKLRKKKQSNFTNPNPWARIVGSRNTAAIYIDGEAATALYDSGADLQLITKELCKASLSNYLKTLEKEVFDELDPAIQQAYYSWEEAAKIREKYGCKPPFGVVKTTKPVTIYAGERKEIHGLTKIKNGGYSVNCINKPAMEKALPRGMKLITGYSPLEASSSRVSNVIENISDTDITIPAKTIVSQLSLANMILKLIYPGDDYDNEFKKPK